MNLIFTIKFSYLLLLCYYFETEAKTSSFQANAGESSTRSREKRKRKAAVLSENLELHTTSPVRRKSGRFRQKMPSEPSVANADKGVEDSLNEKDVETTPKPKRGRQCKAVAEQAKQADTGNVARPEEDLESDTEKKKTAPSSRPQRGKQRKVPVDKALLTGDEETTLPSRPKRGKGVVTTDSNSLTGVSSEVEEEASAEQSRDRTPPSKLRRGGRRKVSSDQATLSDIEISADVAMSEEDGKQSFEVTKSEKPAKRATRSTALKRAVTEIESPSTRVLRKKK